MSTLTLPLPDNDAGPPSRDGFGGGGEEGSSHSDGEFPHWGWWEQIRRRAVVITFGYANGIRWPQMGIFSPYNDRCALLLPRCDRTLKYE